MEFPDYRISGCDFKVFENMRHKTLSQKLKQEEKKRRRLASILRDSIHRNYYIVFFISNLAYTTIHNEDVSLLIFISIELLLSLAFIGYSLIITQYAIIKSMTSALLDMLDSQELSGSCWRMN